MKQKFYSLWAILFAFLVLASCGPESSSQAPQTGPPPTQREDQKPGRVNADGQISKSTVVMISIDGFRADYLKKYKPVTLTKLAQEGAQTDGGMIPSFPSLTFPNHVTLVTGRVPGHHGIVSNFFYDEKRNEAYQMSDNKAVNDGSWYRGEPLWVVAEKAGMLAATYFWVGSEANIENIPPTYVKPYDGKVSNAKRVDDVIDWLNLPEKQRPHFISLYFSDVDSMGHKYGPESREVSDSIKEIDAALGRLVKMTDESPALDVQYVIVSDHGMLPIRETVQLGKITDLRDFHVLERGATTLIYSDDENRIQAAYEDLKKAERHFHVYRREQLPAQWQYDDPDRVGDLVVVADPGTYLIADKSFSDAPPRVSNSTHGWDPQIPEMRALFIARGSKIRTGVHIAEFQNIHVYPFVLQLLSLTTNVPFDGRAEVLQGILQ